MLKIKPVTKGFEDLEAAQNVLATLFPKAEQVPFWYLLGKAKKEFVDFLAFYDGEAFVGLAYLVTRRDLTCILFLAVNGTVQSKGYGSGILAAVRGLYPTNRIVLNIKAPEEKAGDNTQRERRKRFYSRNGYEPAGFVKQGKHFTYETMVLGGRCTVDEYRALFKKFTGRLLFPFVKPLLGF